MAYGVERHSSRKLIGIGAVVLLHIGLVYGLATGLTKTAVKIIIKPFETVDIKEEIQEQEAPPPPPPNRVKPPEVYVPPPEVTINIPQQAAPSNTAIRATSQTNVSPPKVNKRRPNERPPYPPSSRRAGEEGVVELLLQVDENGRVTKAEVKKSSGFPMLDQAAVSGAMRWRFIPATRNGEDVASELIAPVKFSLSDAR